MGCSVAGTIGRWRVRVRASGARARADRVRSDHAFGICHPGRLCGNVWDRAMQAGWQNDLRRAEAASARSTTKSQKCSTAVVEGVPARLGCTVGRGRSRVGSGKHRRDPIAVRAHDRVDRAAQPILCVWLGMSPTTTLCSIRAFEQDVTPEGDSGRTHAYLDGAMFPAFLPGLGEEEVIRLCRHSWFPCRWHGARR